MAVWVAARVAGADEFQLIARHFAPLAAGEPGALGLLDDAAVLAMPPGRALVVTTDLLVEGVHFRADDPPESLGIKVLAVNLSDLAAMGAEPRAYVLVTALPLAWEEERRQEFLAGLTAGLEALQARAGLALVGGDTVATPGPLTLGVTAFGSVEPGRELRRRGARPGDRVFVSGCIGDGALGLRVLDGRLRVLPAALAAAAVDRYRRPQPRLTLGLGLVGLASACADVSDGLIADLGHICSASGVSADIAAAEVPLSAAGRTAVAADSTLLGLLLTGGDDYELVFTAPAERSEAVRAAAATAGVPVAAIGVVRDEGAEAAHNQPVRLLGADGRPLDVGSGGFRHF